jgi:hypothetical protein
MGENDRGGIDGEGFLDNLAGVNRCPVYRAAKQLVKSQDPMPVIEKQAAEELVIEMPQASLQKSLCVRWAANRLAAGKRLRIVAAGEFRQRSKHTKSRAPDTLAGHQVGRFSMQHGPKAAKAPQKLYGGFARQAAAAGTNEDCQQLNVPQLFAGFILHGPMVMASDICLQ